MKLLGLYGSSYSPSEMFGSDSGILHFCWISLITICPLRCFETFNGNFMFFKFHLRKSVEASREAAFLFQRKFVLVSARCLGVITTQGHVQLNCLPDDSDHKLKWTVRNLNGKHCPLPNIKLRLTSFLCPLLYNGFVFNIITLSDFRFTEKFKN